MEVLGISKSTLLMRIVIPCKVSAVDEKLAASEKRRRGAYNDGWNQLLIATFVKTSSLATRLWRPVMNFKTYGQCSRLIASFNGSIRVVLRRARRVKTVIWKTDLVDLDLAFAFASLVIFQESMKPYHEQSRREFERSVRS